MATETERFSMMTFSKSLITEAIASESPAMVKNVLARAEKTLAQHQVQHEDLDMPPGHDAGRPRKIHSRVGRSFGEYGVVHDGDEVLKRSSFFYFLKRKNDALRSA